MMQLARNCPLCYTTPAELPARRVKMAKLNKRARHKRRAERMAREMAIARQKPPPPPLTTADVAAADVAAAAKLVIFDAESAGRLDTYPEGYAANTAAAIDAAAAACPPGAGANELLYHAAVNADAAADAAKKLPPDADDALFADAVGTGGAVQVLIDTAIAFLPAG